MDKLPEARLQLARCDGHMFFTDDRAALSEPADDITRITVPMQPVERKKQDWLSHKNMAALTPVWVYLLESGLAQRFDWVLNVELDHFTRPSMVRSAIVETLDILSTGTEWERSFFITNGSLESPAAVQTKPMLLAFGNAYIFNRALVELMKVQFPIPGMTRDHGCPLWIPGHCEQDMVYPRMVGYFRPPVQMFGPVACGKVQATWGGKVLPLGCWEFLQNPGQLGLGQTEAGQRRALAEIAAGKKGRLPTKDIGHAPTATPPRLLNITDTEWDDDERDLEREREEKQWEGYFPPKNIPLLHHAMNGAVLREARLILGL